MTAHRGLGYRTASLIAGYAVSLRAGCAVLVECDQDASWARALAGRPTVVRLGGFPGP
jgi:hypothetical protein